MSIGTILIDKPLAIELLERAVREKGEDYIDPLSSPDGWGSCIYGTYDKDENVVPMCIVGHVLYYAGVNTSELCDLEGIIEEIAVVAEDEEISEYSFYFTDEATEVLSDAQRVQDNGGTWGNALRAAKGEARIA